MQQILVSIETIKTEGKRDKFIVSVTDLDSPNGRAFSLDGFKISTSLHALGKIIEADIKKQAKANNLGGGRHGSHS